MLRGQRYRLTQIRRIVLTTLEHLHIPGDARVMEVRCKTSGTGLVVAVAWEHSLPPLETAALSRYIVSKIQSITGLAYVQQDVFFEPYLPPQTQISEQHTSSSWLRERIHRLTASTRHLHHAPADDASELEHPPTVPHAPHGRVSGMRLRSKGQLQPGEAAAMVEELRRRLHLSRSATSQEKDTIIDGFLTVHADLVTLTEPTAQA